MPDFSPPLFQYKEEEVPQDSSRQLLETTAIEASRAAVPPINLPKLREWVPDPQALERLIDVYVNESIRALAEVYAGVTEGDIVRVQDATHSWKTSNAWLGSDELVELCLELEKLSRENRIRQDGMAIVQRMLHTFEGITAYLSGPARQMTFPDPLAS